MSGSYFAILFYNKSASLETFIFQSQKDYLFVKTNIYNHLKKRKLMECTYIDGITSSIQVYHVDVELLQKYPPVLHTSEQCEIKE